MMIVTIKRPRLKEIVRAVQEKERQGFECVAPIRKIHKSNKVFKYDRHLKKFHDFERVEEREFYFVKMRKVD
jgi:uncharacterized protein involved in tellurium resistance